MTERQAPQIIYEDNHLLVVLKPPMMPVQGDSSGDEDLLTYLKAYVKDKYNKPGNVYLGLVHRLDRPVGGLMVFARTSKAAARLGEQIARHNVERIYALIAQGGPSAGAGIFKDYVIKDTITHSSRIAHPGEPGAKLAVLEYRAAARIGGAALAIARLQTGRSHQIRVQFASRGWPILNDARYGHVPARGPIALYSAYLALLHPVTGERLEFMGLPPAWPVFSGILPESGGYYNLIEKAIREMLNSKK